MDGATRMSIEGVLLDIDGTLLDSNDAHANSFAEALAEEGLQISFERVRPLVGMGSDKLLPALGVEPHSRVAKHVDRRKGEIFKTKYLPTLKPFHGARDLLLHMKRLGLMLTVATSAEETQLHDLLRVAKVGDLIDAKADASDAAASKPDPDIVQSAVQRSKLSASSLVMIGDTPYDVEAAKRAGVKCIALRCGGWWPDDAFVDAVAIFDDPAHVLAEFDQLLASRTTVGRPSPSQGHRAIP